MRARRALAEPKADVVVTYVTSVEYSLFHDEKAKLELADAFQQYAAPTEASKGSQHEASQVPKPTRWKCTSECKALTPSEVEAVELKQSFKKPMKELRDALDSCDDGCPNAHYSVRDLDWVWVGQFGSVKRLGHPLLCTNDRGRTSKLRILRAASTHFRKLRKFLIELHSAIKSHVHVVEIDQHLCAGSVKSLMEILKLTEFHSLLSIDVESAYVQPINADSNKPAHVLSRESQLLLTNATAIKAYEKKVREDPDCACFSCERLFVRSGVSKVKLSDELGSEVWPRLKAFVMKQNKPVSSNVLYMCKDCKPRIMSDELPARCVLNGLETVPLPVELVKLDPLCMQLIQRAKSFQTIILLRLGTYTGKVPPHNALRACKGVAFHLPLPLNKTLATLGEAKGATDSMSLPSSLPEPEVYIIVNGKPTKGGVLWRNLVNVDSVKRALATLKQINWLYTDVADDCVDEAVQKVIEVSNNSTTAVLEKASETRHSCFPAVHHPKPGTKLVCGSDLEQYKMLSVTEEPLDDCMKHLNVMCFPGLFPDGKFGEFHTRDPKLSNSEYIKSRLLNKESRFSKDAQYVFYFLSQKEKCEISAGVFNMLKCTKQRPMSVGTLLDKVNGSEEQLEGNLSTVLQSVRGSKQYWFFRQGEVRCMIREFGSPTLFLTLSCAEY